MKTQSRLSSKKKPHLKVILIALLVVGLGMLLPKVVSVTAAIVTYPAHAINNWINDSSSLVPSFIRDRRDLENQITELENQLVVAASLDVTQRRLIEENTRLRQLLGKEDEERTLAAVIARPSELPFDLLQIDRGSNQGIEVGAPVFVGKDTVLGLVVYTAPEYAFVELITTPGFEATAFISGPNVAVGLEGVGGGVARVRVPQGMPLTTGQLVYLPSVEPGLFGRISYVENEPTQPEQYGYVTPDVPLSGLYRVGVGKLSQISESPEQIDVNILELMKSKLKVDNVTVGTVGTTSSSTIEEI